VVVVKVLCELDLLGFYEYDFLALSGYIALFSISLFLIVFYIEGNVRFSVGGRQIEILRKFKTENLWVNLILGRA